MIANDNETEVRFYEVEKALKEIGVNVPKGVYIMQNIVGVYKDIENGMKAVDIVRKYNFGVKENSFPGIFKNTTGVAMRDIPHITDAQRRKKKLVQSGYSEQQANEIIAIFEDKKGATNGTENDDVGTTDL